jgi:hypothetical protein
LSYTIVMKTLKFEPQLAQMILNGQKSATWRLFDDKALVVGDIFELIDRQNGESFGTGVIKEVKIKSFATLEPEDWLGHETFSSKEEMLDTYKKYYSKHQVDLVTEIKIVFFDFQPH